jgi:hypothetical protein
MFYLFVRAQDSINASSIHFKLSSSVDLLTRFNENVPEHLKIDFKGINDRHLLVNYCITRKANEIAFNRLNNLHDAFLLLIVGMPSPTIELVDLEASRSKVLGLEY